MILICFMKIIGEESAMKLTGDLKNQVEKAESKDEKKKLIEEAGMELTDEEMDQVAGGDVRITLECRPERKIH